MSYTPILIINKTQLVKQLEKQDDIPNSDYADFEWDDPVRAKVYLKYQVNNMISGSIAGIDVLVCTPEISYFSKMVRDLLDEWGIEYTTNN